MLANCHEASYGLQSMHKNLDHLVQRPISFPSIIWMAKTNWIIYDHGYGQHRRWKMFFQIWGLWRVSPRNRLTTRLDLIVKIFAHKFFIFDTFPFAIAMNIWNVVKSHHTTIEALFIWNNKSLNPNLLYNMFICFLLCCLYYLILFNQMCYVGYNEVYAISVFNNLNKHSCIILVLFFCFLWRQSPCKG
jgi:hypothetical protein